MRWLVPAAVALALGAASASASRSTALACLTGELRATVGLKHVGKALAVTVDVRNIGNRCRFQTVGAAVHGGLTRELVWRKRGTAVVIPRGRTVRLHLTWRNWCKAGPAQVILLLRSRDKQFGLPFFPPPACTTRAEKTRVAVGSPALVPR
jgi:hypothetical protein